MTPDQATPALILEAGKRYVRRDGKITGKLLADDEMNKGFLSDLGHAGNVYDPAHGGRYFDPHTESPADLMRWWPGDAWYDEQRRMIASGEFRPATREADLRRALEDWLSHKKECDVRWRYNNEKEPRPCSCGLDAALAALAALASAPHSPEGLVPLPEKMPPLWHGIIENQACEIGEKRTAIEITYDMVREHFGRPAPASQAMGERACEWLLDDSDENTWRTDCDHKFTLNDGSPQDNGFTFCCFCGGSLAKSKSP